ncbi:MAG: HDOD domain-containing protein [Ignavibacteriaceae bacterium]|nr:HDOD domain-containing protein [Ignavibacteriaceae bacterium]
MTLSEKIINRINNIPTLPTIYETLSNALNDPKVSNQKIAQIISSDQSSAFKVLKVANSPFFGFRGGVDTISQAIMYLGTTEIRNIVFSLSIMKMFSKEKKIAGLSPIELWAHSIGVGILTRSIGKVIAEPKVENYFLAGILHDIGKILLLQFAHEEYNEVIEYAEKNNCLILQAEQQIFGFDHSRIGYLLAEKWRLPQVLKDVILYHSTGISNDSSRNIVAAVHIADISARVLKFGFAGDNLIPEPNIKVWEQINLPQSFFTTNYDKFIDDYNQTVQTILVD